MRAFVTINNIEIDDYKASRRINILLEELTTDEPIKQLEFVVDQLQGIIKEKCSQDGGIFTAKDAKAITDKKVNELFEAKTNFGKHADEKIKEAAKKGLYTTNISISKSSGFNYKESFLFVEYLKQKGYSAAFDNYSLTITVSWGIENQEAKIPYVPPQDRTQIP